jgi:hypothetical protein
MDSAPVVILSNYSVFCGWLARALKRLVELSGYRKRRWSYEDGWLILEGF